MNPTMGERRAGVGRQSWQSQYDKRIAPVIGGKRARPAARPPLSRDRQLLRLSTMIPHYATTTQGWQAAHHSLG
eukprot:scaffold7_cov18-Prasinocladus_malaysianus.AAC.1